MVKESKGMTVPNSFATLYEGGTVNENQLLAHDELTVSLVPIQVAVARPWLI